MSALYAFIYNNLFTHKHLGVLENYFACARVFQIKLEFEKNPRSKGKNQQQTQPINSLDARI